MKSITITPENMEVINTLLKLTINYIQTFGKNELPKTFMKWLKSSETNTFFVTLTAISGTELVANAMTIIEMLCQHSKINYSDIREIHLFLSEEGEIKTHLAYKN